MERKRAPKLGFKVAHEFGDEEPLLCFFKYTCPHDDGLGNNLKGKTYREGFVVKPNASWVLETLF